MIIIKGTHLFNLLMFDNYEDKFKGLLKKIPIPIQGNICSYIGGLKTNMFGEIGKYIEWDKKEITTEIAWRPCKVQDKKGLIKKVSYTKIMINPVDYKIIIDTEKKYRSLIHGLIYTCMRKGLSLRCIVDFDNDYIDWSFIIFYMSYEFNVKNAVEEMKYDIKKHIKMYGHKTLTRKQSLFEYQNLGIKSDCWIEYLLKNKNKML